MYCQKGDRVRIKEGVYGEGAIGIIDEIEIPDFKEREKGIIFDVSLDEGVIPRYPEKFIEPEFQAGDTVEFIKDCEYAQFRKGDILKILKGGKNLANDPAWHFELCTQVIAKKEAHKYMKKVK